MLDKLYITPKQWMHILRWCLYAFLFLVAMMLQTVVFGNRTLLGAHPNFVPVVIVCVCLREGPERGGLFALISSLIWCLSGIDYGTVSLAVLTVLPVLCAVLTRTLVNNRYYFCLLVCLATLFVEQSAIFLLRWFFGNLEASRFLTDLLPCVLISALSHPIFYLIVKRIEKIGDPYETV